MAHGKPINDRILQFHFPGLESPEVEVQVMESHGKANHFLIMNTVSQKKINKQKLKNNRQVRKPVKSRKKYINTSMQRPNVGKYFK